MHLFTTTRHGVSGKELERQLGVTYKTAWRMATLIRQHMGDVDGNDSIGGEGKTVQIDETFVGGRFARDHRRGNPGENKAIVFGMMERAERPHDQPEHPLPLADCRISEAVGAAFRDERFSHCGKGVRRADT